jgi:hypothetical protein
VNTTKFPNLVSEYNNTGGMCGNTKQKVIARKRFVEGFLDVMPYPPTTHSQSRRHMSVGNVVVDSLVAAVHRLHHILGLGIHH